MISIDKLHRMIEQEHLWSNLPRGSGRTFTMLVQAVQSADVLSEEKSVFAVIAHSNFAAVSFLDQAAKVADELGIEYNFSRLRRSLQIGQAEIFFTYPPQLNTFLRGMRITNYFIDHFAQVHPQDINEIKLIKVK